MVHTSHSADLDPGFGGVLGGVCLAGVAVTDLIAKLERATEGSRELDVEIERSYGRLVQISGITNEPQTYSANQSHYFGKTPHYTTSLDAAETLWATSDPLPKRTGWHALQYWNDYRPGGRPYWRVKALECVGSAVCERGIGDHKHKTIAACISALKAREAQP